VFGGIGGGGSFECVLNFYIFGFVTDFWLSWDCYLWVWVFMGISEFVGILVYNSEDGLQIRR
jgi:hypothetical protein